MESRYAIAGFIIRVVMGCLYGFLFQKIYNGDDTWHYHYLSLEETKQLWHEPILFLKNCFNWEHYIQTYEMTKSWESVQYGIFIKLLAFLNIFSGGSYYVNVVLFNMIVFWGAYAFYRFFHCVFKGNKKLIWLIVFCFLPVVFWTSGIRKDGLIFLSIGLYLYFFNQFLLNSKRRYLLGCFGAMLLLLMNRNLLVLTMIPTSIAWFISLKTKRDPLFIQSICSIGFLLTAFLLPFPLMETLIRKNNEFHSLKGSSRIHLPVLKNDVINLFQSLPTAIYNVLFKPLPFEVKSPLLFISGMETLFTLSIILIAICMKRTDISRNQQTTLVAILSIVLLNYLIIGLIVPFSGAIVRYRVIFEFILITSLIMVVDWSRLRRYILNIF